MEALIAGLIAGGLISAGAYLLRRRRVHQADLRPARLPPPRTMMQAQPGDVLIYDDDDLIVRGVARYREGSRDWLECCCDADDGLRWVIVFEDDPDGAWIGARVDDLPVIGVPPESIDHQGEIYRLTSSGQAQMELTGECDPALVAGDCDHWSYARPGSDRLWIRRSSGSLLFFAGERTRRHRIEFIAA